MYSLLQYRITVYGNCHYYISAGQEGITEPNYISITYKHADKVLINYVENNFNV